MVGEPVMDVPSRQRLMNPDPTQPARMMNPSMGTRQVPETGPIDRAIYEAGGRSTDYLTSKGASPENAALGGYLTNLVMQAGATIFGGPPAKMVSPVMEKGAKSLMWSALKPSVSTGKDEAVKAVDTLLEQGLSPTMSGVEKLKGKIADLDSQITQIIANSPATIQKSEVGMRMLDLLNKAKNQVNPQADMDAIKKAWLEFRNHPDIIGKQDIPIQKAHEMKQGTYRSLSKKYGEAGTADTEAQKTLARALREEAAKAEPDAAKLLKVESDLLRTLDVAEKRAFMEMNKNPGGLAWLSANPMSWAAFMADKSSAFKALAARALYQGKDQIPATAARLGIAGEVSESGSVPQKTMAEQLRSR